MEKEKRYNAQRREHNYYKNKNNPQNFEKKQQPLTKQELYDVLKFADTYYKTALGGMGGVYTPYTTNQRLGEINLGSTQITEDKLKQAFKNPLNNQKELIGYSEYLKFTDAIAKRTISYMGNLASFDMTFHCNNINNVSEYNSAEYKSDLEIFKNIVRRFDYKGEFSKALKRMLANDSFYCIVRTDTPNIGFQEMPYEYCLITGRSMEWGFTYDFNMNWFLRPGLDIDMYPPVLKEMYYRTFDVANQDNYNPANLMTERDGVWGLWSQTSVIPEEGGFVAFKWNDDMYANVPFLTSLFNDAINRDVVREMQNNQYIIASQKLLVGLIPLLKDMKSGSTKDMLAISPETMGKFLGVLQQGLRNIKVKGVPFSDLKEVTYDIPNRSIYAESNENEGGNSGVTSTVVYTTNAKTATEIRINTLVDASMLKPVYAQFAKWFTTFVNHYTQKYKFTISFEGTILDREDRFNIAVTLADKGMVDFQALAAARGDDYFSFEEKIRASSQSEVWDYLKLLPNTNTMSTGSSSAEGGRPVKSDSEVAESTERKLDRTGEGGDL